MERALAQLLRGRSERTRVENTTPETRQALDMLVAAEILERHRHVYRASDIALYSSFTRTELPAGDPLTFE